MAVEGRVNYSYYFYDHRNNNCNMSQQQQTCTSYNLHACEEEVFRRRYRFYLETYHDQSKRGVINVENDMLAKLDKYEASQRQAIYANMMAIWHLMTNGAELSEVTVDEAIENYLKIMHSTNAEVKEHGRRIIQGIAGNFFNQLDIDRDGVISLERWMSHYSKWNGTSLEVCKQCFSSIDVEGVGFLCRNDVLDAVQGFFTKATPAYYNNIFGPIRPDII